MSFLRLALAAAFCAECSNAGESFNASNNSFSKREGPSLDHATMLEKSEKEWNCGKKVSLIFFELILATDTNGKTKEGYI